MRYVIIGAGAVGGAIGGRLFEGGHEVVLVARGSHHQALDSGGLRLIDPGGTRTLPVPVVNDPADLPLTGDDVLILAVKTPDSAAALDRWAAQPVAGAGIAAETLPIVCAQNGVENERLALRRFRRVYGMCVWLPATHLEPGVVACGGPLTGILHLGRYPSGTDEAAERIAIDLASSGFLAPAVPDVMRWKYGKLLMNLANALEAVCGPADEPEAARLRSGALAEGAAVLAAAGIEHAGGEEWAPVRDKLARQQPVDGAQRGGGSSWQSLARRTGSIESDYLNGEVAMLGRLHGVPTPVNEVLQWVANRFASERRAPGSMPVGELAALVAAAQNGR